MITLSMIWRSMAGTAAAMALPTTAAPKASTTLRR